MCARLSAWGCQSLQSMPPAPAAAYQTLPAVAVPRSTTPSAMPSEQKWQPTSATRSAKALSGVPRPPWISAPTSAPPQAVHVMTPTS
eukprot:scaffold83548_cov37-Prasinocladus_malaysianus.AAC.1